MEQLKNVARLQQILGHGLGILLEQLFGGLFPEVGIVRGQGLGLVPYRSQILDFHSLYTRNFSIIGVLLL